jgi:hypothetical protein
MYTSEQIELFDKVFNYYVDFEITKKERNNPTDTLFSKKFGIDIELAEFAINKVLEIGDQLQILKSEKYGYGGYGLVRMDKIQSINFQNQGGFKEYFSDISKYADKDQIINIGNNYGQVFQAGQKLIITENTNIETTEIKSNNQEQNKSLFRKVITSKWTITIIGGIIVLIVGTILLHEFGIIN